MITELVSEYRSSKQGKGRKPKELLKFFNSPNMREMLSHASYLNAALSRNIFNKSLVVSVDTSEIVELVEGSHVKERRISSLYLQALILFYLGPKPLYILPGTVVEIQKYLYALSMQLLKSTGSIVSGSDGKIFYYKDAILRIKECLNYVKSWEYNFHAIEESESLLEITKICFPLIIKNKFLSQKVGERDFIDANNLAQIIQFNFNNTQKNEQKSILVTRNQALILADKDYRISHLCINDQPFVIHPTEMMYGVFLFRTNLVHSTTLPSAKEMWSYFDNLIHVLNDPSPDKITKLSINLDFLVPSLEIYGKHFGAFRKWLDDEALLNSALQDRHSADWSPDIIEIHSEAITALIELEESIERLRNAFKVFEQ